MSERGPNEPGIGSYGREVLARLAAMYRGTDEEGRTKLAAAVFYPLGSKSDPDRRTRTLTMASAILPVADAR